MVSQITAFAHRLDRQGQPWRRRNPYPVLIVVVVLAVVGIIMWGVALTRQTQVAAPVSCPAPPAAQPAAAGKPATKPPARFEVVSSADMVPVRPAPLANTTVRVLNASDQNGLAETIMDKLKDYGFTTPGTAGYGDDTVYPANDMACQAQIRFGDAGRAAAASVWIVAPCAQLIDDGRRDQSVDLVLGTYFTDIDPSTDAQEVLRTLRASAASDGDGGANPALVAAVHNQTCS
ncbi:envelope integrity protein Cei [Tsukamurella soli]|uniref:envelope integrity protein Cei n=1 Tax=Tsukamurella soli TaxID=644556 RepID=UPI0031E9DC31